MSFVQPSNSFAGISEARPVRSALLRDVQFMNALSPMLVTEVGSVMPVRAVQP